VARRKGEPVILEIAAAQAQALGFKFYPGNEQIWLADYVPPEFIRASEQ
jgi:putative RNA 2'-phosphotransferase